MFVLWAKERSIAHLALNIVSGQKDRNQALGPTPETVAGVASMVTCEPYPRRPPSPKYKTRSTTSSPTTTPPDPTEPCTDAHPSRPSPTGPRPSPPATRSPALPRPTRQNRRRRRHRKCGEPGGYSQLVRVAPGAFWRTAVVLTRSRWWWRNPHRPEPDALASCCSGLRTGSLSSVPTCTGVGPPPMQDDGQPPKATAKPARRAGLWPGRRARSRTQQTTVSSARRRTPCLSPH
jgi:hypothetical protein